MRKGDVDAAIDRFEDATLAKPGFALPYLYLGEAYEKKAEARSEGVSAVSGFGSEGGGCG